MPGNFKSSATRGDRYLKRSVLLTWLATVAIIGTYAIASVSTYGGAAYFVLVTLLEACIWVLPLILLIAVYRRWPGRSLFLATHVVSISLLLLLLSNYKLHAMYNFFINGFVMNLLTTPGGIDALGLSRSFYLSAVLGIALLILIYILSIRWLNIDWIISRLPAKRYLVSLAVGFLLMDMSTYAWAAYASKTEILTIASRVVWHIPVTARGVFKQLGFERPEQGFASLAEGSGGNVDYPIANLENDGVIKTPYNIVWLTSESLRHDMVDQRIMPNTFAFAQENSWLKSHYSGGNGTRMGMFTQFYGLYGSYWFDILHQRTSPLLLDTLKANRYDMMAYTSSGFSYPEFNSTIFAGFTAEQLQEYSVRPGWQADRKNTDDLIDYIHSAKNSDHPFFAFMFFESAHANYYFPESAVIEPDYLEDFDYLSVDIAEEIHRIKNRYINSAHYLDTRLGLVFDALKAEGLYDNTIVVVTGDHGEEFMEKGRWGHNSTFVQQQIRVPMIIHIPFTSASIRTDMTSHLDMPATLLKALGFDTNPSLYSFGEDLFSADYGRGYIVASDWAGDALITPEAKFVLTTTGTSTTKISSLDDTELNSADLVTVAKIKLNRYLQEQPRFYRTSAEHQKCVETSCQAPLKQAAAARVMDIPANKPGP